MEEEEEGVRQRSYLQKDAGLPTFGIAHKDESHLGAVDKHEARGPGQRGGRRSWSSSAGQA